MANQAKDRFGAKISVGDTVLVPARVELINEGQLQVVTEVKGQTLYFDADQVEKKAGSVKELAEAA